MITELAPPGPLAPGGLRVTALGGISEIGRNMTVFEHLGRLLIIDCGVLFPGHDEPGVDLILPDLRHIEDRLDDIEALVLTHAHEDHIGAIPLLLKLRPDIPVVGSKFTLALVAAKCREHRIKPVFIEVTEGQSSQPRGVRLRVLRGQPLDSRTPGHRRLRGRRNVLHTGDIKLDQLPLDDRPPICPGCRASVTPGSTCSCATRPTPRYRRRAVRKRDRPDPAPADPLGRGPRHRGVFRLQCRSGAADHRRGGGAGPQGVLRRPIMVRNMGIARELGFLNVTDDD